MPDLRETIEGEVYDAICSHFTIWGKPKAQDVCAEGEPDWAIANTVKRATDAILAALSPSVADAVETLAVELEGTGKNIVQGSPGPLFSAGFRQGMAYAATRLRERAALSAQGAGGVKPGSLPDGEGG